MAKLTDVYCTYTGGNIYVCTAKFGDVYLASDLESYGTYDVPYDDIEEKYDCDYDSHWKDSSDPLPTWQELLDAIRDSYERGVSTNVSMYEVEAILHECHPCMSMHIGESASDRIDYDPPAIDDNSERLETIAQFIDIFDDFLDWKGVDIPNDEREDDPCASNIYGTDYGYLSDRIESLLIRYGVLKGE